jgi:hypothetical protein
VQREASTVAECKPAGSPFYVGRARIAAAVESTAVINSIPVRVSQCSAGAVSGQTRPSGVTSTIPRARLTGDIKLTLAARDQVMKLFGKLGFDPDARARSGLAR